MPFLLLDSARMNAAIEKAKEFAGEKSFICLYKGLAEERLSGVAPYLFNYDNSIFGEWHMKEGWGNSWGLFVSADLSLQDLSRHFRRFLMVKTEEGKQLYFRFYDPRVLRIFLPTCDTQQLEDFFGPIHFFFMEDEDPNFALKFSLKNGELHTERIKQNLKTTDK
ncbi:DUF4123 domain-containing protein [Emticicia soli]|uniref:DUF4123 domain-containing protein n=1 Tax=Emticicia soli TaxID=2027878 RepID=A0ABW5J2K2_9BACT